MPRQYISETATITKDRDTWGFDDPTLSDYTMDGGYAWLTVNGVGFLITVDTDQVIEIRGYPAEHGDLMTPVARLIVTPEMVEDYVNEFGRED